MVRNRNTAGNGGSFSPLTISLVWNKGKEIPGYDPNVWRRDDCGVAMRRGDYGNTQSDYGWEVDHIMPVSLGGSDELSNLQPLHWQNNRGKADNYPRWVCTVK